MSAQSAFAVHPTQTPDTHRPVVAEQSDPLAHGTHPPFSQMPDTQSALPAHERTQEPVAEHTGPLALFVQSLAYAHAPHAPPTHPTPGSQSPASEQLPHFPAEHPWPGRQAEYERHLPQDPAEHPSRASQSPALEHAAHRPATHPSAAGQSLAVAHGVGGVGGATATQTPAKHACPLGHDPSVQGLGRA